LPLGGSRLGEVRTKINLFIIFFLCGLWHGASWNMVTWGIYNAVFFLLERTRLGSLPHKLWFPIQVIHFMLLFMFGMVIFRTATLPDAMSYFMVMFGMGGESASAQSASFYLNSKVLVEMSIAVLLAMPVYPALVELRQKISGKLSEPRQLIFNLSVHVTQLSVTLGLVYFACISLASGVYNPFIYYKF
jgi:alginate O-acetyltransferase complex protein AlgI